MPSSLLSTSQARWGLGLLLAVLSGVAIASSAPNAVGGSEMYSGQPGDIRGLIVMMGSVGLLGAAIFRIIGILVPKCWRPHVDRLEFMLVAMLWIGWTSATMAFSAFTLQQGVCSPNMPEFLLPTCPLLTFDLTLLHLLSTVSLALLLVILSAALSPAYYSSLSEATESVKDGHDGLVIWDMALASVPSSPTWHVLSLEAESSNAPTTSRSYGTLSPSTPIHFAKSQDPLRGSLSGNISTTTEIQDVSKRRDKFAEGRLWTYLPMSICSAGVICANTVSLKVGQLSVSGVFMLVVSVLSLIFSLTCLAMHFKTSYQRFNEEGSASSTRQIRALEVGLAGALLLLWPLAAVLYTLFPSTPFLPCSNPSASAIPSPREDADIGVLTVLCWSSRIVITLAWATNWLVLGRIMGLVFPMPEVATLKPIMDVDTNALGRSMEAQSLLKKNRGKYGQMEGKKPHLGWERIVAGEAFELGSTDENGGCL
ncbi:uncharacterized protein L203_104563 [Cryptococcus depauperatus CBS 7841]|uniref:G-protein coupled receptors family 1 profile domain-containing protein n=1 Tax=Cryptococcus depauperatus CBS 7841 TaxID=1295531 RepID=A0AAJ8M2C4_9TREE